MGVYNAEIFTNLGLCCFYSQQYDMALTCFQRALGLASDETLADVWYNIGHVAVVRLVCACVCACVRECVLHACVYAACGVCV